MTAPRTAADRLYRWEPVEGDCRVHAGPHEGFRCNGAIGRYIEAEAAAPFREALERLVEACSVVIVQDEDIDWLIGPRNEARALLRREVGE